MKNTFLFSILCLIVHHAGAQSKWSIQNAIGFGQETNLSDQGIRLSCKLNRVFDNRWAASLQIGAFQMLGNNEDFGVDESYTKMRSLSTFNIDLGPAFYALNQGKFQISLNACGAYRIGRQLWPERTQTVNGHRDIFYTHEKISEFGYEFGCDIGIKLNDKVGIFLDGHCHSYNYFGEYLGFGLGSKINL